MTLKIYVSPTGRLIREDIGKPAEVALADVFRHTLNTQERTDALAGVYGDEVRIRVLEIEADTPVGGGGAVASVAGKTGTVTLVRADVGLSNVDNTNDANKPISTAQAAVNASVSATVATKADKLTTVSVSAAGNFDLTEAAHNGRRIVAAVPGVVFTKTTAWGASSIGCFLDVDADGTFTLGTGITVPSGCAAGSATAAGGAVDLACVDGVLSSKTAALVLAATSGMRVIKLAPVADVGPGVTTEALIWEGLLSGLAAGDEVDVAFRLGGSGAGSRTVYVKVNGAAGASDGSVVSVLTSASPTWRYTLGFAIGAGGSSVIGVSGNIVAYGATSGAGHPVVAVTPGADVRVKLVSLKTVAADVINLVSAQVRVFS